MICAASRMPVFNEEEEEQLRKIMAGEFWEEDMPDFSDNLPTREKVRVKSATTAAPARPAAAALNSDSEKKVTAPNANWRTATDAAVAQSKANPLLIPKPSPVIKKKKPVPAPSSDYLDFSDLDYDDFESAMRFVYFAVYFQLYAIILILSWDMICREEENGGMNPGGGGSKNTAAPEQHAGLDSADVVPSYVWDGLLDSEGLPYKFTR